MDYSKKLVTIGWIFVVLMVLVTIIALFLGRDITNLVILDAALITAMGSITSFYMVKTRYLNRDKYAQKYVLKWADKYGVENAIQIAEVVLRD